MIIARNDVNRDGVRRSDTVNRISTKNQLGTMRSKERVAGSWSGPEEEWIVGNNMISLMQFGRPTKKMCSETR